MATNIPRRTFLKAGGIAAASATLPWTGLRQALAAENLVAVQWGGPWIESSKQIVAKQKDFRLTWELHAGGAAAILAKIKATWPVVKYDTVAAWSPVFLSMIKEDWLEPVTYEEVPNLRDVPETFVTKDDQGSMYTVPTSIAGMFWGYRTDLVDGPITKLDDLLEPRFKGKVCWPGPTMNTMLQVIVASMYLGGDEQNLEPGWDFLKELAKRGNIGYVANTEQEFINAMNTGQTAVSFWNQGAWNAVVENHPVEFLKKVPGIKNPHYVEGWTFLKGGKTKAAKQFVNFFVTPENNTQFNEALGQTPTNSKAKASPKAERFVYTPDEVDKYVFIPDWDGVSAALDARIKRWESEVVPLLA